MIKALSAVLAVPHVIDLSSRYVTLSGGGSGCTSTSVHQGAGVVCSLPVVSMRSTTAVSCAGSNSWGDSEMSAGSKIALRSIEDFSARSDQAAPGTDPITTAAVVTFGSELISALSRLRWPVVSSRSTSTISGAQ